MILLSEASLTIRSDSAGHTRRAGWGVGFIAYAGGLELKYRVAKSAPIMKAVHEGYRIGKAAKNIVQEDIAALLREPLVDARKRLGIADPVTYKAAHAAMRSSGIDPYNLLAAAV